MQINYNLDNFQFILFYNRKKKGAPFLRGYRMLQENITHSLKEKSQITYKIILLFEVVRSPKVLSPKSDKPL